MSATTGKINIYPPIASFSTLANVLNVLVANTNRISTTFFIIWNLMNEMKSDAKLKIDVKDGKKKTKWEFSEII